MADYFSNFRPPSNPSIFSENYARGVQTKKQQGTKFSNFVEGLGKGLDTYEKFQDVQLKQEQIEQAPLRTQILEQQVKNNEQLIKTNELKLEVDQATQTAEIDSVQSELEAKAARAKELTNLIDKKNQFQQEYASMDPLNKKRMIQSGQYADVFAEYPQVFSQSISQIVPYSNPQEILGYDAALKKSLTNKSYDAKAQQNQQRLTQLSQQVEDNPWINEAADAAGILPQDVPSKARLVPHGKYKNTVDGLIESPGYMPEDAKGQYDIIIDNKVVSAGVNEDTRKLFSNYTSANNWVNGTYKRRALSQIDQQTADQLRKTQGNTGSTVQQPQQEAIARSMQVQPKQVKPNPAVVSQTYLTPIKEKSGEINIANNPVAINNTRLALGLTTSAFKGVEPEVKNMLKLTEVGPQDPYNKQYTGEVSIQLGQSIQKIADYTAGQEYETTPGAKDTVSEAQVIAHNKLVDEFMSNLKGSGSSGITSMMQMAQGPLKGGDLSQMIHVETPKDLYILKHSGAYKSVLSNLAAEYGNLVRATKIATLKFNAVQSTTMNRLQKPLTKAPTIK